MSGARRRMTSRQRPTNMNAIKVPAMASEAIWSIGSTPVRHEAAPDALTPRESEILQLVAQGRSNGEIAKLLFISAKTVSVHVSNILGKLDASGRTEAAAIARRRGLIA